MMKRMSQLRALVAIVCTTVATKNWRPQKLFLYLCILVFLTLGFSVSDTKNTVINVSTSQVAVRDVSPPVFTNCPGDVTITLAPGSCRMPFDYEPLVEDVCDNVPVVTQLAGPLPGSELEKNTTTIYKYEAVDENGNRSVCRFSVSVQEFGASQNSLICNAQIQITLDTNCQTVVTPDLLLKGQYGCIEDFSVELFYDGSPLQSVPTSPELTSNELRRNIIARVTDTETGLFCDTRIFVEDKFIPSIQCRSYTVKCTEDIKPAYGGTIDLPLPGGLNVSYDSMAFPYIPSNGMAFTISAFIVDGFDPCGLAQLTYADIEVDFDCADTSRIIFRNWTIADESGNSATCQDTIYIERATVSDAIAPPSFNDQDRAALKCEDRCPTNLPDCGTDILGWNTIQLGRGYDAFVGHPAPWDDFYPCNGLVRCEGTGMPTGFDCGDINVTFTDTRFDDCSVGASNNCFRILRRWSLFDWCNGSMEIIAQNIEVSDGQGPMIAGLTNDTIITDVFDCESIWNAQIPVLQDNCSSNPLSYNIESSSGQVVFNNGVYQITNLALGTHAVRYIATDCCGNESSTQILVTVVDEVPPVPVCDQSTVVGLSFSANSNLFGITKIFARTFDNGSYDNCGGPVYFKAIRLDEIDANGNSILGEAVSEGDWSSITCSGSNGDDDLRINPPFYQSSQSYFDDYVDLCCNDIDQGPVTVVLRVFDVDPEPYTFGRQFPQFLPAGANPNDYNGVLPEFMLPGGPLYHHYSDCEIEVIVQDRVAPLVVAPPDITVTCDFWFAFDPDRPNDFKNELDSVFGKVGNVIDPRLRDSIYVRDRVCPAHPKFVEYAPSNNFDAPCYDDQYAIFWGTDGYVIDNCEASLEQDISADMNCNRGRIVRSWQAVDGRGNWSNTQFQNITIIDCKEFYVPTTCWRSTINDIASCDLENNLYKTKLIEWPCDVTISSCLGNGTSAFLPDNLIGVVAEDRRPRFDDDNCSMIAATYTDEIFVLVDSACQNILREWHVIDWCLYDDFRLRNYSGAYQWFYRQLIRLENTTGPVFGNCNDQTICGFGDPSSPPLNPCSGTITLDPEISDDCTKLEDLSIHYKIDFDNDGTDDELGYSTNQGNQYPFPNPNNLPVRAFDAVNYARSDLFSVGTHRVLWNVEDGCGNSNSCQYLFTIEDYKPPTAFCETGISTIPMPQVAGGFIDIWASDFDLNSSDNCTASSDLVFSFSDNINDQTIRRTCDDVTDSIEYLTIYIWDEANNFSTCVVGLFISDCDLQFLASLSGTIYTEENEMINEVMVMLDGDTTGQMMTASDGFYQFADLNTQEDYRLIPEKDTDPLNGVSTYDLVLISQHILDVMPFTSPYKMIAADINKDGRVTAFDMVQLRKLILYVDLDFSDNTSWRFVPADFVFIDPLNPFAFSFPEIYTIDSLSANWSADFVGIKTGDVNNSVRPNRLLGSEDRNMTGTQLLRTMEKELIAGQTYHSKIRADQLNQIKGLQYTLKGDENKIKFLNVTPVFDAINEYSFGQRFLDQNILTTSWNGDLGNSEEIVLFSLEFEALQNCKLSDVLSISDEYTVAEAYTFDDELLDVSLIIKKNPSITSNISLFQNQPNPFRQSTLILFYLPENIEASIEIFDVMGRNVKTIKKQWQKGTHKMDIDRSMLGAEGVYYFTLRAGDKQLTEKMILID